MPAPVVQSLDGKRVHIGGYVVPLDFEATRVKEFLLVPFVGACIHVPPPPANQIVYVKTEQGFDVQGTFDPVWVTGTLTVTPAFTGLAEAGYTLDRREGRAAPAGIDRSSPVIHCPQAQAAFTLRAASSQPLILSMSGGSPLRSTRWPSLVAAKASTSAHNLSASAPASASAER